MNNYNEGFINSGRRLGGTMGSTATAEMTLKEREEAAEAKRALRMKQRALIDAEEDAVEERMRNKLREDIRKKEKLILRSRSRENEARERNS